MQRHVGHATTCGSCNDMWVMQWHVGHATTCGSCTGVCVRQWCGVTYRDVPDVYRFVRHAVNVSDIHHHVLCASIVGHVSSVRHILSFCFVQKKNAMQNISEIHNVLFSDAKQIVVAMSIMRWRPFDDTCRCTVDSVAYVTLDLLTMKFLSVLWKLLNRVACM